MAKIVYVGGGKGGVGKSLVSIATIDWLRHLGKRVVLIEGDVANPDAHKCYEKLVPVETWNFDVEDGWNELGDLAERTGDEIIVVNSGARVIEGVRKYGHVLDDCARAGIDVTVLWPINRARDSVIALKDFRSVVTLGEVGVIRNLFFGPVHKFTRWNESTYAQAQVRAGVRVANLDELSDRIVDRIYDDRIPIEEIVETGSLVDRSNVTNWRGKAHAMLGSGLITTM